MKKVLQRVIYSGAILSLVLPVVSFALIGTNPSNNVPQPDLGGAAGSIGITAVYDTLDRIANYFLGILIGLAVIFIIYGAFLFLTSGGDDTKTKNARKMILYALVAIAVGLLAKGLVQVIRAIAPNV